MIRNFTMRRLTHAVSTSGRLLLTTAVGLLVIVLAFAGISQTLAVWNSQATATGSASGAQLELTTDFGNAGADFANHRTSVTGSFTLTNDTITASSTAGQYVASIAATGDQALRTALTVTIWPQTSEGCTAAATPQNVAATGTWATSPFTVSGNLVAQQTHTYCMRMTAADRSALGAADGNLVINPGINATLTVGNWTANASGGTVQSTAYIFPQQNPTAQVWYQLVNVNGATTRCASVNGAGTLSAAACNSSNNQHLKFVATGDSYHEVVPRVDANRRLDVAGAATTVGSSINTQAVNASRPSQDWQTQYKGDVAGKATYQVVNRNSGYCMQISGSAYAQQACNGSAAQSFTLDVRGVDVTLNVTCTRAGSNVAYLWTGPAVGSYVFQFQNGTTGPYAAASPAVTAGTSSMTFTPAQIGAQLAQGLNTMKVTWLGYDITTTVGWVWKEGNGASATLGCQAPTLETLTCLQAPPNSVTISWGHNVPVGTTYTIELVAGSGGGGNTEVAIVTAGNSSHTVAAANWADGTRILRIISSTGPTIDIQVAKSGGTGNGVTERLWCLTESPVTITCNPAGTANRSATVMVSWPVGSTGGSTQALLEVDGNDAESFRDITTSGSNRQITVPANAFPLGTAGTRDVRITLIGDTAGGGLHLGSKTFDTTVVNTGPWWWPTMTQDSRSRCQ